VFDDETKGSYSCKQLERQNIGLSCDALACPGTEDVCARWGGTWKETCESNEGSLSFQHMPDLKCCLVKRACSRWNGRWISQNEECNEGEISIQTLLTDDDKDGHPNQKCCAPSVR
jgi:hypothetical protein